MSNDALNNAVKELQEAGTGDDVPADSALKNRVDRLVSVLYIAL